MVVSKRKNKSAPWKQYLTPIWSSDGQKQDQEQEQKQSIIQCLEKYSLIESNSDEKNNLETRIMRMGEFALELAGAYGKDSNGGSSIVYE